MNLEQGRGGWLLSLPQPDTVVKAARGLGAEKEAHPGSPGTGFGLSDLSPYAGDVTGEALATPHKCYTY